MTDRSNTEEPLPVRDPPFDAPDRDPDVSGVLLAAGTSTRFGDENKLLARRDGDPIVELAARTLVAAGLDPIVVVVGYEADRVAEAVSALPVRTVHNPAFESGQASSVRTGVRALDDDPDAAVVALGDMPFVDPGTVETLVSAYSCGVGDTLAAAHDGVRGNPVLFDRRFFGPLTAIDGDVGGRGILLEGNDSALVAVDDPGVRRDVDDPGDL